MPSWFYILRLKSGTLYPGATTDLTQRWRDHQSGQACRTTKIDPPTALVFHEQFDIFAAYLRCLTFNRPSRAPHHRAHPVLS